MTKKTKKKVQTNLKRKALVEVVRNQSQKNGAGSKQYKISDAAEKLISMVGVMFNEPKYYPQTDVKDNADAYDATGLEQQAQDVINTAIAVAQSESPRDLLAIAHWARTDLKMRTTPQVLLAVAAHCSATKEHVRKYVPLICKRPDEVKQVFIAYRHLFGTEKGLPNSLKRGMSDKLATFRESHFLKYEGQERPYWSDILRMVDRKKDWPVTEAVAKYLGTGEIIDAKKTPVFAARKALNQKTVFDAEAKSLAEESSATWENLLSKFGNTKEVWEFLIKKDQLGYMAMLRNLRNFLEADLSLEVIQAVADQLVMGAQDSKQLPFRFLSAQNELVTFQNTEKGKILYEAVGAALDAVVETLPKLPGSTLIACDTSGSMSSPVSGKSKITCLDAAAVLGAIAYKLSTPESVIGAFSTNWTPAAKVSQKKGTLEIARTVKEINVGGGTEAHKVLEWALVNDKKFDRILIISDMQTYEVRGYSFYGKETTATVAKLLEKYRKGKSEKCYMHSIDLAGYGTSLTKQSDTLTNLVSGYSEKVLDTIKAFEGIKDEASNTTGNGDERVFTIEQIRAKY